MTRCPPRWRVHSGKLRWPTSQIQGNWTAYSVVLKPLLRRSTRPSQSGVSSAVERLPSRGIGLSTPVPYWQNRNGIIDTKYVLRLPGDLEVVLPGNLRTLCYLYIPYFDKGDRVWQRWLKKNAFLSLSPPVGDERSPGRPGFGSGLPLC